MQVQMRQELGRSQGLLAVERPGGKGMRLLRHASESGHGTKPKPTLPGHRCCAGRKAEPKGEATEGPWGVGSLVTPFPL
jgi:hypothetical protein